MKDQIQFETNGLTMLAVKVPEDAYLICLNGLNSCLGYSIEGIPYFIDIPEGNWKYHCTTSDITYMEAFLLLEMMDLEMVYLHTTGYETRIDFLLNELRSHGIDPNEKRVLLIKPKV